MAEHSKNGPYNRNKQRWKLEWTCCADGRNIDRFFYGNPIYRR
jgi:hypothetical protein